ncbi:MAG: AraC family transcriptional regulator [Verrucomicrobia bacterium]|nr:AraC family transcriptional regulator [Verrucomicrobiota bacterium]MDE3098642.1 helix-turn-helix transcriptional regulator [Verrucomicrobiota bacterium]
MSVAATTECATNRSRPERNGRPRGLPFRRIHQQRLYGNDEQGIGIEGHDFELDSDAVYEWSRQFQPDCLELCLNLAGEGSIRHAEGGVDFEPLTGGFYAPGRNELRAWRKPRQAHRFVTARFSRKFLRDHLLPCDGALHDLVGKFLLSDTAPAGLGEIHRLNAEQERMISQLLHPPSFQGARRLWYQGRLLQLMADFFFERRGNDELFCDRQKRLARERVDRVIAILRRNLAEPPALEEIGCEAGCSPFYLSRTFSRETGTTIPQYLRKLRMERAAELLKSGKYNVTEAAMEVGYSSLSHFSQAFCQTMGCCPALYPLKRRT